MKEIQADVYHFGNVNDIEALARFIPKHKLVMGNIDPINVIQTGNVFSIETKVESLLDQMHTYEHFKISIGCDVPYQQR